ncbi:unnamed protein product [Urochloa decumbens]|uniref:Uncharacterized protein n=1 Tax=Urochloa decumbens TaxID=240449 RepID=A0ABC9CW19_9POAL
MWGGVVSLVRQGLRRRPRRRTARVVDEGAPAAEATAGDLEGAPREVPAAGALLARAVLAMARGAVGLDDGEMRSGGGGGGAEEAWAAASGWRPARAPDEVGHLVARESLRYIIYA